MKKKYLVVILFILIIIFLILFIFFTSKKTNNDVFNKSNYSQIYLYDLGNSNIELIIRDDFVVLINTGLEDDRDMLLDYLDQFGIEEIDYLILTNRNDKYIGNASYILEHFIVDYVYLNDYEYDSIDMNVLDNVLLDNYTEEIILTSNEKIVFGDLEINIYPFMKNDFKMNDKSFIINLKEGDNIIYLTYDNSKRLEEIDKCNLLVSENKLLFDIESKYYIYDGIDKIKDKDNFLERNISIYINKKEFIIE